MEEWMDPHMIFTSEFVRPIGLVDYGLPHDCTIIVLFGPLRNEDAESVIETDGEVQSGRNPRSHLMQ